MPFRTDKRSRFKFPLMILLCLGVSCHGQTEEEVVLVKAWGAPLINLDAFHSRLAEESPECRTGSDPSCWSVRKQLLDQMINEALLLKIAKERGIEVSKADLEEAEQGILRDYEGTVDMADQLNQYPKGWRASVREHLLVYGLFEEVIQGIRIEEADILTYFNDHRELFVRPREVRVRQIVVARADEALEILNRLKNSEDFIRLAEKHSLSPEGVDGGDLGFLRPGQMPPELEDVVFSLGVGEISDVIPSPYGFHIVRVEERREPSALELSEVEFKIRRRLLLDRIEEAYQAWLTEKRDGAQIEIMDFNILSGGVEGEESS